MDKSKKPVLYNGKSEMLEIQFQNFPNTTSTIFFMSAAYWFLTFQRVRRGPTGIYNQIPNAFYWNKSRYHQHFLAGMVGI